MDSLGARQNEWASQYADLLVSDDVSFTEAKDEAQRRLEELKAHGVDPASPGSPSPTEAAAAGRIRIRLEKHKEEGFWDYLNTTCWLAGFALVFLEIITYGTGVFTAKTDITPKNLMGIPFFLIGMMTIAGSQFAYRKHSVVASLLVAVSGGAVCVGMILGVDRFASHTSYGQVPALAVLGGALAVIVAFGWYSAHRMNVHPVEQTAPNDVWVARYGSALRLERYLSRKQALRLQNDMRAHLAAHPGMDAASEFGSPSAYARKTVKADPLLEARAPGANALAGAFIALAALTYATATLLDSPGVFATVLAVVALIVGISAIWTAFGSAREFARLRRSARQR